MNITFVAKKQNGGYAMLTAVMFFLFATSVIVLGTSSSVLREMQVASDLLKSKASYFTSESGSEDVIYRKKNSVSVSSTETLTVDGYPATTVIGTDASGNTTVTAQSDRLGYTRKIATTLTQGAGAGFYYGVQVGNGGLTLNNSASVVGNVYSSGPVVGASAISSNANNPTFISSVNVGPNAYKLVQNGSYVYVVNDVTVQTVDVSNPASPVVVSTVTNPAGTSGQQKDVAVANGYLFVTATNYGTLLAFSLSNPALPVYVGQVTTTAPQALETSGSYAYVLSYSGSTLKTVDISNPGSMSVTSTITTNSAPIELAIQGNYLYVVSQGGSQSKLEIFSLTNPASPTLVGSTAVTVNPIPLTVNGSYAYVGSKGAGKLEVVNVSNPSAPVLVGDSGSNSAVDPKGLYGTGSYLYAAISYSTNNLFQVWDVSNPTVWSRVSNSAIFGGAPVFVTGGPNGYIYLLTQNSNAVSPLRIYQVTGSGGNTITGDVVSAGPSGSITQIHATSSLYAHTIANSLADKNAYYQSVSNTTVRGLSYPGSVDQATTTMPIADSQTASWEAEAQAGGSVTCNGQTYSITTTVTLGPKKIPCDLDISNSGALNLTGPVWVAGSITISNNSDIYIDSSLPGKTIPIIADNISNHSTGSTITLSNSGEAHGAGANSYVLFISQNSSAENGGNTQAIGVNNSFSGEVLLYAPHGLVSLDNSISLREVTGYKVVANNSAKIIYSSGIANLIFTSGPSGGYSIGSWGASQ
ncbi:MAG: hypothetical protein RLZZ347_522 [Candidatus Parcubacteria bacterium]|jgi:hypothetical protein